MADRMADFAGHVLSWLLMARDMPKKSSTKWMVSEWLHGHGIKVNSLMEQVEQVHRAIN